MSPSLFRGTDRSRPASFVSLVDELGAYESLWTNEGQSFAKIANILRGNKLLLSELVDGVLARELGSSALVRLKAANVPAFGLILHGTAEYPTRLRDARNPVELLYYSGCWGLVGTKCLSVVGSREATFGGREIARQLVKGMVADGYTVVSGLAKGVDTAAHETAISEGGKTIAVIGTPLTEAYPKENAALQRTLAERQLVISQVPVEKYYRQDWRANRLFFPERNVTMSALSEATVIVEASDTSGTLTQARAALSQGRQLFIMDNCFRRSDLSWPTKYLSKGAIRVGDYGEIRQRLGIAAHPN